LSDASAPSSTNGNTNPGSNGGSSVTSRAAQWPEPRAWTRSSLAAFVGGLLEGNDGPVARVADPEHAGPQDVVAARHAKYLEPCLRSRAGLIVLPESANLPAILPEHRLEVAPAFLRVSDPELAWERLLSAFAPTLERPEGIDPSASVHSSATLGAGVHVGPNVTIGRDAHLGAGSVVMAGSFVGEGSSLGADCVLAPNVSVLHHVTLGDRVFVQAGAVVGADGFGFRRTSEHAHVRLPHVGTVIVEDDVEIGANSVIDRATVGETRLGARCKIGPGCIVAHNSSIGRDALLIGAVQMGGSTSIGDRATVWGQVGIAGHLEIGADATVTAQSGVSKSLGAGGVYGGSPARLMREFARDIARVGFVDGLRERVGSLERLSGRLAELEAIEARVLELERKLGTDPLEATAKTTLNDASDGPA
jgi:UDP-3-O-[3-hydroxymyristoyl] glucosamine N-acyltransferase